MVQQTRPAGVIDVHEHYVSQAHVQALIDLAGPVDDGIKLPKWSAESSMAVMDRFGIEASVLSPVSPPPQFRDVAHAREVCRAVNEGMASVVAAHPTRFGATAMLPMPFVEATLDELRYSLDVLELDGAHLYTSYRGLYLGAPEFEPVLAELDARSATVIVHPTTPQGTESVSMGRPTPTLEFPFDTARTAADLLYTGSLERFPAISWILPHGGGALMQVADRIARSVHILRDETPLHLPGLPKSDDAGRALLYGLYLDVCWSTYAPALGTLAELFGADHLLFGSDRPFEQPPYVEHDLAQLAGNPAITDDDRANIRRENALRLFPGLAKRLS